jgi:hypothetical protein
MTLTLLSTMGEKSLSGHCYSSHGIWAGWSGRKMVREIDTVVWHTHFVSVEHRAGTRLQ